MSHTPRLEIDLDKIYHNACTLVQRLGTRGISVTAVTKATLGSPAIARVLARAGVVGLGDSRIENIEAMRNAGVTGQMTLIRTPMISQAAQVVKCADTSLNTEISVIRELSAEAVKIGRTHGVVLMVELGDLREGIMPSDVVNIARETHGQRNVAFAGIGANLACRSGVSPDAANMAVLSELADSIQAALAVKAVIVSGGNSANLDWAFGCADVGRINNLRLGEAILLGREARHRRAIDGLYTDAFTIVAEVIESKAKPSIPSGDLAENAFGSRATFTDRGVINQTILAIGIQDIDPLGLQSDDGFAVCGASSDHLILNSMGRLLPVGSEVTFQLNYSALLRAMTSPFVAKCTKSRCSSEIREPRLADLPQ